MSQSSGGAAKTGPLRHTENYVFNSADCLGKGATASVYLGRHKENGDVVAIKAFNAYGCRQIGAARNRELELLPVIKHKNVMRFIACEKEVETSHSVLVMEYCQAGSLYTVLDQPQNGNGLQEKEFLKFLTDLSSGLQYLRSRSIVHRDIKPGNIMKRVEEDGSISYVLTDFGASRELEDGETFMSLHGTEEYLHPEMYQQAVLRQPGHLCFTSSVDLWSIGVTVYHVATGRLPFKAYGGRADTQTMFQITSSRQSGVISGVQQQANGQIIWSRELPATCHLSECLRRLLEPILAGLFESDPRKALTFDRYFRMVSDIGAMKTVKVFHTQRGIYQTLYLHPTENFTDLQEKLASLTEIPADRQLILMAHRDLTTVVEPRDQVASYPNAVLNAQMFLFEKENYEIHRLTLPEIPPFPSMPGEASLAQDASTAKKCASTAYYIQTRTQVVIEAQALHRAATACLRQYIKEVLRPLDLCVPKLDIILELTNKRYECLLVSQNNLFTLVKLLETLDSVTKKCLREHLDFCSTENGLNAIIEKARTRTEEIKLYKSVLEQRMREQEISHCTEAIGCVDDDHCFSFNVCLDTKEPIQSWILSKHVINTLVRQLLQELCSYRSCLIRDNFDKFEYLKCASGNVGLVKVGIPQKICVSKVKQVCQDVHSVYTTFARHKKYGDLHKHEQFIHSVERQRLSDLCVKLLSLYQGHCLHGLSQLHLTEQKQSGTLLKHLTRTGKVEANVSCVTDCQAQINEKLDKLDGLYKSTSLSLTSRVHEALSNLHVHTGNGHKSQMQSASCDAALSRETTKKLENKQKGKATSLIDLLVTEMTSLQTETCELDKLMKSNTSSLIDLKRMLQETSSLNTDSFHQDQCSTES